MIYREDNSNVVFIVCFMDEYYYLQNYSDVIVLVTDIFNI